MGRLCIVSDYFPDSQILKNQKDSEIQLTDALKTLCTEEPVWGVVYKGRRFDCGTQKGLLSANVQLALDDPELRDVIPML